MQRKTRIQKTKRSWLKSATAVLLCGLLTIGTAVNAGAWTAPEKLDYAPRSDENVKLRFAVGSDIHTGRKDNAMDKLKNAFDSFYQASGGRLDAFAFVGDITNMGYSDQFKTLMGVVDEKVKEGTEMIYCMGNHENYGGTFFRFRQATGQNPVKMMKVNGVTFITLAPDASESYTYCYTFLKSALKIASAENPGAPIFVLAHHPVKGTVYGSDQRHGHYGDCEELLEQYPQVIHISGHIHTTIESPCSIDQSRGFTALSDGTLGAYSKNVYDKISPTSGTSTDKPDESEDASSGLMVEVSDDNVVTVYRLNLTNGKYIYEQEPWVIDTKDLVKNRDFTYTSSRHGSAPSFAKDAKVTLSDASTGSIKVSFPAATPATQTKNNDMIYAYNIYLKNKATGSVTTRSILSDFYNKEQKKEWTVKIANIDQNAQYSISVDAQTAFGDKSEAITQAAIPTGQILNIDYSTGSTQDTLGHTLNTVGKPELVKDTQLGRDKTTAKYNGSSAYGYQLQKADYQKMLEGYTLEAFFKLDAVGNSEKCIFSGKESAGMGLGVEGGKLTFYCYLTSGKVTLNTSVQPNRWTHAAAIYDGSAVRLFVNGKEAASKKASGYLTIPAVNNWFTGADVSSGNSATYYMNGFVKCAKLYGEPRTDAQLSADVAADAFLVGDLDKNIAVNLTDFNMLMSIIRGTVSDQGIEERADINGDGKVSVSDAMALAKVLRAAAS